MVAEMPDQDSLLAHMVYFSLHDNSPAAAQKLVDACHKYLKNPPGVVYFAAGTLVTDLTREVNDREFDVSLNLIFKNRKAHDEYQAHPQHLQFIAENKPTWKKVRVFDSYVT